MNPSRLWKPTVELRWIERAVEPLQYLNGRLVTERVLQQKWVLLSEAHPWHETMFFEWRDISVVTFTEQNDD